MSKARDTVETLRTVLVAGDVTNANFTGADLEVGKGGTGASSAGAARTALGLAIGTDVLAPNGSGANLTNLPAGGATSINGLSDGTNDASSVGLGTGALANDDGTANTNTAIGTSALTANTIGTSNTANGYESLKANTAGDKNTASGYRALYSNTDADKNSAHGTQALYSNTTGLYNTASGHQALFTTTTGANCTAIGHQANAESATISNDFTLGNLSVANLRCNDTSISSLSDERDKTNITDLPDSAGLAIINALRPVTFNWDRREWYDNNTPDGSKVMPDWRRWKANSGLKYGFIAQEVQATIAGEKCMADSMIVTDGNLDRLEFAPQHLLTNAIKAIQQLSEENEALKIRLTALENA